MKKNQRNLIIALTFGVLFVLWTLAVSYIDVMAIGPEGSEVGFATLNGFVHELTGVHMMLYTMTDWLGLVPFAFVFGFAILGLVQLIRRRSFLKVDRSILVLGGFYVLVMAAYLLFENVVINYRPVLIEGILEVSYPSSTTMLTLCVIPTAMMQIGERIKGRVLRRVVLGVMAVFGAFMVVGRLISGVHWFTDIIGGTLLSVALVMLYCAVNGMAAEKN